MGKLTKKQKMEIIQAYTVTKTEYVEKSENFFYHNGLHASITISIINDEPDYFLVTRTDTKGKIKFRDKWKMEKDGSMAFESSSPADAPISNSEIIDDLKLEIEELKKAGRKLQEENQKLKENSCIQPNNDSAKNELLEQEFENLKSNIDLLKQKNQEKDSENELLKQKIENLKSDNELLKQKEQVNESNNELMEQEIKKLKSEIELLNQKKQTEKESSNELLKQEIEKLNSENAELLQKIEKDLSRKGRAGRKKDIKHKEEQKNKILELKKQGKTPEQIQDELKISRTTYFRRIKDINN